MPRNTKQDVPSALRRGNLPATFLEGLLLNEPHLRADLENDIRRHAPTLTHEDMEDIWQDVERWQERGEKVALATVTKVIGSAPRREGAKLAVSESGEMSGSVSGGCVEADVVMHALEVLDKGTPRLVHYGISDEMAFEVGLACGGSIEVFIEPLEMAAS